MTKFNFTPDRDPARAFNFTPDRHTGPPVEADDKPFWSDAYEVGRQFGAGAAVDLPRMVGQGMRWMGNDTAGREIVDAADARAQDWEPDMVGRGGLASTLIKGSRGIAPMAPAIAAAFVPAVGVPLAAGIAATQFGTSAAQDTEDKLRLQGVNDTDATRAGWQSGLIQGPIEGLATVAGAGMFKAGRAALGANPAMGAVLERMTDTAVLKPFAKSFGLNLLVQPATEVAQDLGTEYTERAYGAKPEDAMAIAKDSAQGGLGMTLLLGPFGFLAHRGGAKRAEQLKGILESDQAPMELKQQAWGVVSAEAKEAGVDTKEIADWLSAQKTRPARVDQDSAPLDVLAPAAPDFREDMAELGLRPEGAVSRRFMPWDRTPTEGAAQQTQEDTDFSTWMEDQYAARGLQDQREEQGAQNMRERDQRVSDIGQQFQDLGVREDTGQGLVPERMREPMSSPLSDRPQSVAGQNAVQGAIAAKEQEVQAQTAFANAAQSGIQTFGLAESTEATQGTLFGRPLTGKVTIAATGAELTKQTANLTDDQKKLVAAVGQSPMVTLPAVGAGMPAKDVSSALKKVTDVIGKLGLQETTTLYEMATHMDELSKTMKGEKLDQLNEIYEKLVGKNTSGWEAAQGVEGKAPAAAPAKTGTQPAKPANVKVVETPASPASQPAGPAAPGQPSPSVGSAPAAATPVPGAGSPAVQTPGITPTASTPNVQTPAAPATVNPGPTGGSQAPANDTAASSVVAPAGEAQSTAASESAPVDVQPVAVPAVDPEQEETKAIWNEEMAGHPEGIPFAKLRPETQNFLMNASSVGKGQIRAALQMEAKASRKDAEARQVQAKAEADAKINIDVPATLQTIRSEPIKMQKALLYALGLDEQGDKSPDGPMTPSDAAAAAGYKDGQANVSRALKKHGITPEGVNRLHDDGTSALLNSEAVVNGASRNVGDINANVDAPKSQLIVKQPWYQSIVGRYEGDLSKIPADELGFVVANAVQHNTPENKSAMAGFMTAARELKDQKGFYDAYEAHSARISKGQAAKRGAESTELSDDAIVEETTGRDGRTSAARGADGIDRNDEESGTDEGTDEDSDAQFPSAPAQFSKNTEVGEAAQGPVSLEVTDPITGKKETMEFGDRATALKAVKDKLDVLQMLVDCFKRG